MICWCRAQVIFHLTRLINSKSLWLGRHCYQFTNLHWKQWPEQHLRKPSIKLKQTLLCASFKQVWIKTNNSRSLNSPLAHRIDVMGYINWQLAPKNGKNTSNLVTCNWAMKHYLVAVPESCCRRSKKTVLPRCCWVVGWTLGDSRGGSRRLTSSGTREGTSRNCPGHRLITRLQKAKLIMREQLSYLLVWFFFISNHDKTYLTICVHLSGFSL